MKSRIPFWLLAGLTLASCGEAQHQSIPMQGIAVDCTTGRVLSSVIVLMETLNESTTSRGFLRRTMTNQQGEFRLPAATGYDYRIEATAPGYHPAIVQSDARGNVQLKLLRGSSKDPTYGCQTAGACRPPETPDSDSRTSHLPPCPAE